LTRVGGVSTIEAMATYPIRTRRWTRKEYDRLVDIGFLHEDEPIELIGGQMIVAEPKGSPHATAVGLTAEALRVAFGPGWAVRQQDPVALDDESEPEPDVIVVPGRLRDYRHAHPSSPALIVEVAESSLSFDRRYKGSVYARAGIADYWIVNLRRRVLEVYREPVADAASRFGWKYDRVRILKAAASVSPLAMPTVLVAVADLLP
jgi:Uma2 family endonuclease